MFLRQFLPIFFLPVGITVLVVTAGLRYRRRWLIGIGVGFLWLSSTPLISWLAIRTAEGWSERRPASEAPVADAIVVLSEGRAIAPGRAAVTEWRDADRFYGGVELFQAGKASLLVFTGGWLSRKNEALLEGDTLTEYARELGVPAEAIATTGRATNTAEEALAVAQLLHDRPEATAVEAAPRILLVTSAFHMARARLLFHRAGLTVVPFPVDFQVSADGRLGVIGLLPSAAALAQTEMAWREMYGRLFYAVVR